MYHDTQGREIEDAESLTLRDDPRERRRANEETAREYADRRTAEALANADRKLGRTLAPVSESEMRVMDGNR